MKMSTFLLVTSVLASSIPFCDAMENPTPDSVRILFMNRTGGDISFTQVYTNGEKSAPRNIENGGSYPLNLKVGKSPSKESVYLDDIERYEIRYNTGLVSQLTNLLVAADLASSTSSILTITPSEFKKAADNTELDSTTLVQVTIQPLKYEIKGVLQLPSTFRLDKEISVIVTVPLKERKQEQAKAPEIHSLCQIASCNLEELKTILGALGITSLQFEPHELFKLETLPEVSKGNEKSLAVQLYVIALQSQYKQLKETWNPASDNGEYDQGWFNATGIKDFSAKASAIIDDQYKKLLKSLIPA